MGLKANHQVYNEDFTSSTFIREELESKIEKLNEMKSDIQKQIDKDYDNWDNNKLKVRYVDILNESILLIDTKISEIENLEGEVR